MAPPTTAEKILGHLKGLRDQMRADEQPLFSIPAIWEHAGEQGSHACDLVLTNQRLFGYIYTTFPRERLFLDALELAALKAVTVRQKTFELLFSELFVSDGHTRISIRAPRKKIERTYLALRQALADHAADVYAALEGESAAREEESPADMRRRRSVSARQLVRQPLERSPQGIALLLTGGLVLEMGGALVWAATGSSQTGGPLLLAGLVAVVCAILARRQLR
ncbi:MAG TPA: hypothetical protein VGF67_27940 [Ktedonobacteraceae bacterium]|jgi:hypothetical protein